MSNSYSKQDNAIEQLSRLTGGLAHEIRNPLSTLKVNLQLLAEDLRKFAKNDNDKLRRSLLRIETMRQEVDRLSDILDDFIQFVKQKKIEYKPCNINHLIGQLVDFYEPQAADNGIKIRCQYHPGPLIGNVDDDMFKQAILNLFINAQQAMPNGGELMIKTSQEADKIKIEVIDTGIGIEHNNKEELYKIFEAYYSTKKEGTGLGLAMTKRIIEQHNGTISVHSEPGKGTSFTILLPIENEKSERIEDA